jgi:hypothetical protein
MSTIPEVLVAVHCGINVFSLSLITNECVIDEESEDNLNHADVMQATGISQERLSKFVARYNCSSSLCISFTGHIFFKDAVRKKDLLNFIFGKLIFCPSKATNVIYLIRVGVFTSICISSFCISFTRHYFLRYREKERF